MVFLKTQRQPPRARREGMPCWRPQGQRHGDTKCSLHFLPGRVYWFLPGDPAAVSKVLVASLEPMGPRAKALPRDLRPGSRRVPSSPLSLVMFVPSRAGQNQLLCWIGKCLCAFILGELEKTRGHVSGKWPFEWPLRTHREP